MTPSSARLQQASLYLHQKRYTEAEKTLRTLLTEAPEDLQALLLLSESYIGMEDTKRALQTIRSALGIAPDHDYLQYQYARILLLDNQEKEALANIETAIRMNPEAADYFALQATIQLHMKQYQAALASANAGLQLEADNNHCLNVRAQALVRLKQPEAAYQTIATSLENDPENSHTHTNLGWTRLQTGQHEAALDHFREALRLDPSNEYAKSGMVESLKAKNTPYRLFLRYKFWIAQLSAKYQWGFLIGIYVLYRILLRLLESFPDWKPLLLPLIMIYVAFAMSTWFMDPLSNLFLLTNKYGRYALERAERHGAILVGSALGLSLLCLLSYVVSGLEGWMATAVFFFTMMIPLGSMLNPPTKKARQQMIIYTLVLAGIGLYALGRIWLSNDLDSGGFWSLGYLLGLFAYQWVLNAKMTRY